jgi:hypothetical protein
MPIIPLPEYVRDFLTDPSYWGIRNMPTYVTTAPPQPQLTLISSLQATVTNAYETAEQPRVSIAPTAQNNGERIQLSRPLTLAVYIGYDERQDLAYRACRESILQHTDAEQRGLLKILPLKQRKLREQGLYNRAYYADASGTRYDSIDRKPFSTDFSFTRFLVPYLADFPEDYPHATWYLFVDSDFIFRTDIMTILDNADYRKPVSVVKHNYKNTGIDSIKMDNQIQSPYNKKLWSSLMLFNEYGWLNAAKKYARHEVNYESGSYLHQFEAFDESSIGALDEAWNFIPDHSEERMSVEDAKAIHYTEGVPLMPYYRNCKYASYFTQALTDALDSITSEYNIYKELDR